MHPALAHSLFVKRGPPYRGFLIASLAGHVALVGLGFLYAAFFGGSRLIDLDQKPIRATLVRLGKPRDQKLLPRREELPPPPQKSEAASAAKEPPKPPERAAVEVPLPGIKPPEAKAQKKQGEPQGDRKQSLFSAFDRASKSTPTEELEGQADGDPHGDSATAEGERYWGLLSAQVRRHYDVAQTLPEQERLYLKAQVLLKVDRGGAILSAKMVKTSGNSLFDNAVISAVKKASPFSPPPEHLRDLLHQRGVALEFTP